MFANRFLPLVALSCLLAAHAHAQAEKTVPLREALVLRGHTDVVRCVAFSPDGQLAVSSSNDKTVRLWDLKAGKLLHTLMGHTAAVSGVVFAPNGKQLLSGSADGTLRTWDVASSKEVARIKAGPGIWSVAVSPDGSQAVTAYFGDASRLIRLWDLPTGKEVSKFEGPPDGGRRAVFTPDRKYIFSTNARGIAQLWDLTTGAEARKLEKATGWTWATAFSPDGKQVLTGGRDGVRLSDLGTGLEVRTFAVKPGIITAVAFSPDGKRVRATGSQGTVRTWDRATAAPVGDVLGLDVPVYSAAFSADGKQLLIGTGRNTFGAVAPAPAPDFSVRLYRLPE